MKAYEETIRETATKDSPWYVVPADNKWFTRVVVAAAVIDALASLKLHYPKVERRAEGGTGRGAEAPGREQMSAPAAAERGRGRHDLSRVSGCGATIRIDPVGRAR